MQTATQILTRKMAWTQTITPYGLFKCNLKELSTESACVASGQVLVWRDMRRSSVQRSCGVCHASMRSCVLLRGAKRLFRQPATPHPTPPHPTQPFTDISVCRVPPTSIPGLGAHGWVAGFFQSWERYSILGLAANSENPWISLAPAFLNISGQTCTIISVF